MSVTVSRSSSQSPIVQDVDISENGSANRGAADDSANKGAGYGAANQNDSCKVDSSRSSRSRDSGFVGGGGATESVDPFVQNLIDNRRSKHLKDEIEKFGDGGAAYPKVRRRPGFNTLRQRASHISDEEIAMTDIRNGEDSDAHTPRVERQTSSAPGRIKRTKYRFAMVRQRMKDDIRSVTSSLGLWTGHFRTIEGQFGTGVTSYFRFLRGLLFLNIPVFLLTFSFVTIPQIAFRWEQQDPVGYVQNESFHGWELLIGQGWFEDTELFYGYYTADIINITGLEYDMKYAYLCTGMGYYLLTLVILAYILSSSYKNSFLQVKQESITSFTGNLFNSWDFTITHPNTSRLKHKAIFMALQEYLSDKTNSTETVLSGRQRWIMIASRAIINLTVIGIIIGSGALMWHLSITQSLNSGNAVEQHIAMPLCISALNFILPIVFALLAKLEKYENPRLEIYVTMLRTMLLAFGTLGVLVYFWFYCPNNPDVNDKSVCRDDCWQTFVGSQLYTLTIVDFLFIIVVTFFAEFLRSLISKRVLPIIPPPEFDVARNTLNIIYSQILVWLGTFYCPLLSLIMIIKIVIIFYVKRVSVVQNCVAPARVWRAGRMSTIIFALVLLSFFLSLAAVVYGIVATQSSSGCGPYQNYDYSYKVLTALVDDESKGSVAATALSLITSAAVIAFVVIVLMAAAYYSYVVWRGHNDIVEDLQHRIEKENEEKHLLLELLKRTVNDARQTYTRQQSRLQLNLSFASLPQQPPAVEIGASSEQEIKQE